MMEIGVGAGLPKLCQSPERQGVQIDLVQAQPLKIIHGTNEETVLPPPGPGRTTVPRIYQAGMAHTAPMMDENDNPKKSIS
jgi:hypothetical protein